MGCVVSGPQGIHLMLAELDVGVRLEEHPGEFERGVVPDVAGRVRHLTEGLIGLAPEVQIPGGVESFDGAELGPQPVLELAQADRAAATKGRVVIKLIVDLPADDALILAELFSHTRSYARRVVAIDGAVGTPVPAASMTDWAALFTDREYLRIALREPGRRGAGGGAHNSCDAGSSQLVDHQVQPVEVILALLRFHPAPGELADAHHIAASALHKLDIFVNQFEGPILGIIRSAQIGRFEGGHRVPSIG